MLLKGNGVTGIKGTFGLNGNVFDRWLDFSEFKSDMNDMCEILQIRSSPKFQVNEEKLKSVHTEWRQDILEWRTNLLPPSSDHDTSKRRLSHLKKTAILLEKFCKIKPFFNFEAVQPKETPPLNPQDSEGAYSGELPNKVTEDMSERLMDGENHYLSYLITYHLCDFFEANRTDRIDAYIPRVTDEFELDFVSFLFSGQMNAQAIHMIFKALFLRD